MDVTILRISHNAVFDNMYCKPPQSGGHPNGRFSVAVHFETEFIMGVPGPVLFGQYDFEEQEWDWLPSASIVDGRPKIKDKDVKCWWHHPSFEALCFNARTDKHGNDGLRNEPCGQIIEP